MPAERDDHVAHLVDDYLHDLLGPRGRRAVAAHCATCGPCARALAQAQRRLEVMRALPPSEPSAGLAAATLRRVERHQRRRALGRRWSLGLSAAAVAASALLMLGLHVHYANLRPSPANLIVLGQSELLANTAASLRFRLVDSRSGRALAGVPVLVTLFAAGGEPVELARFETDDRGGGSPRVRVPDWADGDYQLEVRAGDEVLRRSVRLKRSWKVLLTSDRPIYQPGQTVLLRCLALRRPDLRPVAGEPVVFTLTDPRGNIIFKHSESASAYGISSAECPLAAEVAEGDYVVSCKVGDSDSRLPVQVRRYVLPRFAVKLNTDQTFYAPGAQGRVTVKAEYFHGQPVGGAAAEATLADAASGRVLGRWAGQLDDAGTATATFTMPPLADGRVRLSAVVRAEETNSRALERVVTSSPVRAQALPEGGALVRGVNNTVYLLVTRADGTPVGGAEVLVSGDAQARARTGPDGAAAFRVTPVDATVTWHIEVRGSQGDILVRRDDALQCGAATGDFLLRPNRPVYKAGQSLTLAALGGGAEPVFVDLLKDGQALRSETIEMANGAGSVTLDLPAELAGTLEVLAYRFTPEGGLLRKSRAVYVAPADGLKVIVDGLADEYRPGASAELRLTLTDARGRPTPGAVSLAAVDEAVFALLAPRPGDEAAYFHLEQSLLKPVGDLPPWRPELAGGRDGAMFAATARTVRESALAGGPHSLGAATFPEKQREVEQARHAGLRRVQLGWLLTVAAALLFVYIGMWIYLPWAALLQIHGGAAIVLLIVLGFGGLVVLREGSFPGAKQAAAPGAGAPGPLADRPGGEDGDAEPRVRRHFPETLLWQPQLISDDHGKLPPVKFTLADSITTWRLSATAVSADGRLGAAEARLLVRQDFFVEPTLPARLTRGDEVGLPVTVYNYLKKPQSVRLALAAGDGLVATGAAERTAEVPAGGRATVRFDLRAAKVGTHKVRLTAKGADVADAVERELLVEPDGRRVEVAQSGTLDRPADVTLSVPNDAIEGSVLAQVKLYPSTFSQVVEGLDSLLRLPTGCFEQTSSALYPNVLVLDYLKRTGRASPAVEKKARQYIHLGYQRLLGFEVSGGGFDWYGRPPANRVLSAYGLMELGDLARVREVDAELIGRTRRWLLQQREPDGSWAAEDRFAGPGDDANRRLAATAYIAWAALGGDAAGEAGSTRQYLLDRIGEVSDPYTLSLCCLALQALGEPAEGHAERLAALARAEKDGRASWRLGEGRTLFFGGGAAGDVEATALAVLALLPGGKHAATARAALAWLVEQKAADGTWHSTQATILALKALLAGTGKPLGGDAERVFEVQVGKHTETRRVPADQAEVMLSLNVSRHVAAGRTAVRVVEKTKSGAGYQVVLRYHVPEDKAPTAIEPFAVAVAYDRTEVKVGETVTVRATVTNQTGAVAPMVMLEVPVPPGFALAGDELGRLARAGSIGKYEAGASGVVVYLRQLAADRPAEVSYTLRATMPVKASVRAARAYEYYDPRRQASGGATAVRARE